MKLPGLLDRYTGGEREHEVAGPSVGAALQELDERFPGLYSRLVDDQGRLRAHIRVFSGSTTVDSLAHVVSEGQTLQVIGALSGG